MIKQPTFLQLNRIYTVKDEVALQSSEMNRTSIVGLSIFGIFYSLPKLAEIGTKTNRDADIHL